jgi:predicted transposase
MKKPNNRAGLRYTVCGEWFPKTYPAQRNPKRARGAEDPLTTEMRLFCACTRWAFNRLQEGLPRLALKKQAQGLFGLNSRYCDDAILKAGEVLDSRQALLTTESKETDARLARAKRKLKSAEKDLAAAIKTGEAKKSPKPN